MNTNIDKSVDLRFKESSIFNFVHRRSKDKHRHAKVKCSRSTNEQNKYCIQTNIENIFMQFKLRSPVK